MKEPLQNYTLLWVLFMTRLQLSRRAWCLVGVSILRIDRRGNVTSKMLLPILRYRFTPMRRKQQRGQLPRSHPPVACGGACHLVVSGNNHSTLKLARTSQFWRAVIFSMPRIWPTLRRSSRTRADKLHFILEWCGSIPLDGATGTAADVFKVLDERC